MSINKNLFINKYCTPSLFYFYISVFSFLIIYIQNLGNNINTFCVGIYDCRVSNKYIVLFMQLLYIFFWTYILDLLCRNGFKSVSWFIVLLPYIVFFILLNVLLFNIN